MNPSYRDIPAGEGVDGNTQSFEFDDAHVREKARPTRRRFGPLACLLVTFPLALLVFNAAAKKISPPEAAASDANVKNIDEELDAATKAGTRPRMIFCYGDSLTFGMTSEGTFPYSEYLEQELNTLYDADATPKPASAETESQSRNQATIVQHLGLPGWTASQMLDQLHDEENGACDIVQRIPKLDLMVILAGTNDIGQMTRVEQSSASDIVTSIVNLHKGVIHCAVEGEGNKAFHTLAVGIPGSAYQEKAQEASDLASHINSALGVFASEFWARVSYVDFPIPYEEGDPKWATDGLHLTQEGYEALGRELAPHVKNILDNIGLE